MIQVQYPGDDNGEPFMKSFRGSWKGGSAGGGARCGLCADLLVVLVGAAVVGPAADGRVKRVGLVQVICLTGPQTETHAYNAHEQT